MKKLLLLTIFLASAAYSQGQCTPETDFGDEPFGVAPDTIVNFVEGEINNLYFQQIDVKVPENGGFAGFPTIPVDSARVLEIAGLPNGLTYECAGNAATPCTYIGGTIGCAIISGIPEEAGTFELTVTLQIYTPVLNTPLPFDGYRIVVDGPLGLESNDNLSFKMDNVRPNPANTLATIFVDSKKSGFAEFRVFDLVGKEVHTAKTRLVQGKNKIEYATAQLPEGVYIYRLDAFGESMTSRLVVVH